VRPWCTGLERHVDRRSFGGAGGVEGNDLGVSFAGARMKTGADQLAVAHDDGADGRIRGGAADALHGFVVGEREKTCVVVVVVASGRRCGF